AEETAVARPRLHDGADRRAGLALHERFGEQTIEVGIARALRRRLSFEDRRDLAVLADELAHLRLHRIGALVREEADVEVGGAGGGDAVRAGAAAEARDRDRVVEQRAVAGGEDALDALDVERLARGAQHLAALV